MSATILRTASSKANKKTHRSKPLHQQQPQHRQQKNDDPVDPEWNVEGKPYAVRVSPVMGRYLVAAQDVEAGSVVLQEDALVVGPCQNCKPVCLGCHKTFETGNYIRCSADEDDCHRCMGCQWPLCSPLCPGLGAPLGHTQAECAVLGTTSPSGRCVRDLLSRTPLYNVIVPLRILLLQETDPTRWKAVRRMQSHDEVRRELPAVWQTNQLAVVDRIRNEFGQRQYKEEEIHTICGILEVNAFEVGDGLRALYDNAFLLAHDCTPNTSHTDDETRTLVVRASVPIPKDQAVTLSYAYTLQGTLKRREHLKESKFFDCRCARCSDPTELGTLCSALRCPWPNCEHPALPVDPLQQDAAWRCRAAHEVPVKQVKELLEKLSDELEALDANDVAGMEAFLDKHSGSLHPNHYLLVSAKHSLSQLYGKVHGFLIHQLPDALLERKLTICRDILRIFDVLEPGITRLRGITLYEMHAPIMILTTRQFEARTISRKDLRLRLKEVAECLENAASILAHEPESSSEGAMAIAAADALERVRQWR